jgi:DNA replication protein DnaC
MLSALATYEANARNIFYGSSGRPIPNNTVLVGPPGIGKTLLTAVTHQSVCAALGITWSPGICLALDSDFRYFDSYRSKQHLCLTLDEWAALSADKTPAEVYSLLIKITGEAPFQPPMADLNKMGTEWMQ